MPSTEVRRQRLRFGARGLLVAALATALPAPAAPLRVGPYQDVTLSVTAAAPALQPRPWSAPGDEAPTVVWAFATGACGDERWGAFDTAVFAAASVQAFVAAGRDYIVSTGGQAGVFSCDDAAGLERFLARYRSPHLVGLDFDIEGRQTPAQIDALVRSAALAQRLLPGLRISFTLATHAAQDGTRRSLNATGEAVLAALQRTRVDGAVVNLMVMDYGQPDPRWCVTAGSAAQRRCDMGRSALQAADNVHERYRLPYDRIALTPMLGENDVLANTFTADDAAVLAQGARDRGLAGVHYWSMDRDQPCPAGTPRVAATCHGLPTPAAGGFGRTLWDLTRPPRTPAAQAGPL